MIHSAPDDAIVSAEAAAEKTRVWLCRQGAPEGLAVGLQRPNTDLGGPPGRHLNGFVLSLAGARSTLLCEHVPGGSCALCNARALRALVGLLLEVGKARETRLTEAQVDRDKMQTERNDALAKLAGARGDLQQAVSRCDSMTKSSEMLRERVAELTDQREEMSELRIPRGHWRGVRLASRTRLESEEDTMEDEGLTTEGKFWLAFWSLPFAAALAALLLVLVNRAMERAHTQEMLGAGYVQQRVPDYDRVTWETVWVAPDRPIEVPPPSVPEAPPAETGSRSR